MKLLVAVINIEDSPAVLAELTRTGFHITKISSSGEFLREKNTTVIMGVEDEKVSQAIDIISQFSSHRSQPIPKNTSAYLSDSLVEMPAKNNKITVGGATVFVLDVEQFYKL